MLDTEPTGAGPTDADQTTTPTTDDTGSAHCSFDTLDRPLSANPVTQYTIVD